MSGCGEPYQMESVPQTMRSGPRATQQLAEHVGRLGRATQHEEPGGPELGVDVAPRAEPGVGDASDEPVDPRRVAAGVVGPLLAAGSRS